MSYDWYLEQNVKKRGQAMNHTTDKELSRQLLHDLRILAEKHFGNETYGKYLNYQHELQELLKKDKQSLLTEARIDELGLMPITSSKAILRQHFDERIKALGGDSL